MATATKRCYALSRRGVGSLGRRVSFNAYSTSKRSSDRLAGSLAIGVLTSLSLAATTALTIGTASATPATLFSSTTAGSYAVTVPTGVTSVSIVAVGGTGGAGDGASGGEGAVMTVNAAVTPGDSLSVTVGADGDGAYGDEAGGAGTGPGGSGPGGGPSLAGGGGGGSAVYDGSTPLVVAGGGGGGGGGYYLSWGGNADQNGNGEGMSPSYAGQAGTLNGPGAAGYFCCYTGIGSGFGMDGGEGAGGGGGGGGYFGGGGGSPSTITPLSTSPSGAAAEPAIQLRPRCGTPPPLRR